MIVKAPGVVKLLGEHAVVYGRLSVAVGIGMYAKASLSTIERRLLRLEAPGFGGALSVGAAELDGLYDSYTSKSSIEDYISENSAMGQMLPFATIAARLKGEFGIDCLGSRISMSSDIPMQRGLASSAALAAALSVALVSNSGSGLPTASIIDASRDGERIMHRNENAGRIDVGTACLGGCTYFSAEAGAQRVRAKASLTLLIIDTGPKKSTAEMVKHVADLYKKDRDATSGILDRINECSLRGLDAIRSGDLKSLGEQMCADHELLRSLGVSSKGLDKAVKVAMENGAYGAKLSGGGGGGIAIALSGKGNSRLVKALESEGFPVIEAEVSDKGAVSFLKA